MNRRTFLKDTLLAMGAACVDLPALAAKVKVTGEPNLRIGILSDIHINNQASIEAFHHALTYFRERGVDGVIIAGDMADQGWISQLQSVADTWRNVFPKDKGADGRHVERLFVYGNHDMEGYRYGKYSDEQIAADGNNMERRAAVWKKVFGEKFQPIYLKTIKGYSFVGAHWYDWQHIPGVDEFLQANRERLEGTRPFFYFQHAHPKDTCLGDLAWAPDNGTATEALCKFPNAVAFSGHSHTTLLDERDIWQGAFTSVGTASLSYLYLIPGRENSDTDGPSQMDNMPTSGGKQGMVMSVYDDCIILERREFVHDQSVGDDWLIPLPFSAATPLSFENRAREAATPQFANGDCVAAQRRMGKDRQGSEQPQIVITFPSVLQSTHGSRAYDYEVQAEHRYYDVDRICATKRVFSPGCFLNEAHDRDEVSCVFGTSELPTYGKLRFIVRPCECFGKKGRAICTDWMDAKEKE